MDDFIVRKAERKDVPVLHILIDGLALHEKRPQDVTGTDEEMVYWLFERNIATALIAELGEEAVGYAIFYPVYGSYAARGKIHLEDIFIKSECRGKGYGKRLLAAISRMITAEGFTGLEWNALDYNDSAIGWYRSLGAEKEEGRSYFSFGEEALRRLSAKV